MLNRKAVIYLLAILLAMPAVMAWAADEDKEDARYSKTIENFRNAGAAQKFFNDCYGFAVFPRIGKGGVGIGGATGPGRVYLVDKAAGTTKHVADSRMTQLSVGFQFGGKVYAMIIFFEDERAFKDFSSGNFAFGAEATVTAITAGAGAQTSTEGGTSVGASAGKKDATSAKSGYSKGMATFTIDTGGLMYEATLKGMKFSYKPI